MGMRCSSNSRMKVQNTEECTWETEKTNKKTLQAENTLHASGHVSIQGIRRAFLCILNCRKKASLTVEAAVVVPLFLIGMCTIFCLIDIYRVQSMVKLSLHQSAQELGMYAYAAEIGERSPEGVVSSAVCAVYAKKKMPDLGKYVEVSTVGSSYKNHIVTLYANITYRLPISILPLPALHFHNESQVRGWTGRDAEENHAGNSQDEMVYVTDHQSVYHTSSSCTHLQFTVKQDTEESIHNLRNAYGGKYHSCEKCGKTESSNGIVYYTEKGDCYHKSTSCGGLTRTVRLVKKSELGGIPQCQRCKARNAA